MLPVGGELVDGLQIKDSRKRLKYRLNAFFVLTVNIIGFFIALLSGIRVTSVSDKLLQLTTSGVLLILLFSIVLYLRAGKSGKTGMSYFHIYCAISSKVQIIAGIKSASEQISKVNLLSYRDTL